MSRITAYGRSRVVCMSALGCGLLVTAWAAPIKQAFHRLQTPEQVADALDGIIQPQFQKDAAKFGIDRFLIEGHDHVYVFDTAQVPALKKTLAQVAATRRPYAVAFLHCVHKPGKFLKPEDNSTFAGKRGPLLETLIMPGNQYYNYLDVDDSESMKRQERWEKEQQPEIAKAVLKAVPQLQKGKPMEATVGKWIVTMRPVRANKTSCLSCHQGAKAGDTLGVMVYAVSRTVQTAQR